jgi:aspartyl protease family protein
VISERVLWIVLGALGLTVVALAMRHQHGTIAGLEVETFARFVYLFALLVVIGGAGFFLYRSRIGQVLRAAVFWIAIGVLLAVVYTYRFELEGVSQRVLSELLVSRPANLPGASPAVQVARTRTGEFTVQVQVNGARVDMLVDTGASSVVLTTEAAQRAGLPLDLLRYDIPIETASGRTRAAAVVIDRIAIGSIVERKVPALVSPPGELRTSLLGMSFLNRLASFEISGGRLIMRAK